METRTPSALRKHFAWIIILSTKILTEGDDNINIHKINNILQLLSYRVYPIGAKLNNTVHRISKYKTNYTKNLKLSKNKL